MQPHQVRCVPAWACAASVGHMHTILAERDTRGLIVDNITLSQALGVRDVGETGQAMRCGDQANR
jgi:hypothetical protein